MAVYDWMYKFAGSKKFQGRSSAENGGQLPNNQYPFVFILTQGYTINYLLQKTFADLYTN